MLLHVYSLHTALITHKPVPTPPQEEYGSLMVRDQLLESVRPQLWWLLKGFYEAVPRALLLVFDPEELGLLLNGVPSECRSGRCTTIIKNNPVSTPLFPHTTRTPHPHPHHSDRRGGLAAAHGVPGRVRSPRGAASRHPVVVGGGGARARRRPTRAPPAVCDGRLLGAGAGLQGAAVERRLLQALQHPERTPAGLVLPARPHLLQQVRASKELSVCPGLLNVLSNRRPSQALTKHKHTPTIIHHP